MQNHRVRGSIFLLFSALDILFGEPAVPCGLRRNITIWSRKMSFCYLDRLLWRFIANISSGNTRSARAGVGRWIPKVSSIARTCTMRNKGLSPTKCENPTWVFSIMGTNAKMSHVKKKITSMSLTSGNLYRRIVACIVSLAGLREKPMSISFFGFRERW